LKFKKSLIILIGASVLGITTNTASDFECSRNELTQQKQEHPKYHERQKIEKAEQRLYWPRLKITSKVYRTATC